MKYLRTSQIARATGIHPNTVRLYEKYGLLPLVPRNEKGYRLYTERHLEQVRLIRIAFRSEFAEGNMREKTIDILKLSAREELNEAIVKAYEYLGCIKHEHSKALDALDIIQKWIRGSLHTDDIILRKRSDVANFLEVTTDTLRNWERNNLIVIPRSSKNSYGVYGSKEISRLKVIRTLRLANCSMMSILTMMQHADAGNYEGDLSSNEEEMKSATGKWISTLLEAEKDTIELIAKLKNIKRSQDLIIKTISSNILIEH